MPNKISPESSDGLFRTPLELFSLEREGRPVAGRPFHLFLSLRYASLHPATERSHALNAFLLLMRAARRPRASRPEYVGTICCFATESPAADLRSSSRSTDVAGL